MNDTSTPVENLSYAEAISELETILSQIEDAQIDVDTLSSKVERAASLLKVCRQRLVKAETQVKTVLADMEETECLPPESLED